MELRHTASTESGEGNGTCYYLCNCCSSLGNHIHHQGSRVVILMEALEVKLAHCQDDLATLQGNVRRIVRQELTMLRDALHALQGDKPAIVQDHIERVMANLSKLT